MERERTLADRLHSAAIHLLRWARVDDVHTGLSAPRLSVLSVLVFGGTRTVGELASAEQVSAPTMTRLVQGLEAEHYVSRRQDSEDGRVQRVSATSKGRRALERGRRMRLERVESALSRLSERERAEVLRGVELIETALAAVRQSRV